MARVGAEGGDAGSGIAGGRVRAKKKFCCKVSTVINEAITLVMMVKATPVTESCLNIRTKRSAKIMMANRNDMITCAQARSLSTSVCFMVDPCRLCG